MSNRLENEADFALRVRQEVYSHVITTGRGPAVTDLAHTLGSGEGAVQAALRQLADSHVLVLQNEGDRILMAAPFSAVPTAFVVEIGEVSYWGNCIWDALGIAAMLGADATITTGCGDCNEPMQLEVRGGSLQPAEGIVHFALPALQWWDDIVYT